MFFESILPLVGRHKRATKHAFRPDRAFASPWHNWAHFGETDLSSYLCLSRKRKSAGFSSFCVFGANYPIWAEKLSYRIVKIISKPVKICSLIVFTMYLKVIIFSDFIEIFKEQISVFLIIPKLSRRVALTIANAKSTLCAGRGTALTSFEDFIFSVALGTCLPVS